MINVIEEFPGENKLDIAPQFLEAGSGTININGRNNSVDLAWPHFLDKVSISLSGDSTLSIGWACTFHEISITLAAPGVLTIGERTAINSRCQINIHESANISIGDGCLFGGDVTIACSDSHKIIDAETNERINPPADIIIGDNVWLAAHVSVWGGTRIGSNSVVGFQSFVGGKQFEEGSLIAGIPARLLRTGIRWEH